jgi:hypothetical protein
MRPVHRLFHDQLGGVVTVLSGARWLQDTALAQTISQSTWAFPTIESIHVIAIALVVGSIAVLDLRILGLSWKERSVTAIAKDVLPWTWGCFVVAVVAGSLMFISAAAKYVVDLPFQLKMFLILMAGVNMIVFHRYTYPDVAFWDKENPPPFRAKLAAGLSLALWIGVVTCGRLVSFTTEDQFGPPAAADAVPQHRTLGEKIHFAFEGQRYLPRGLSALQAAAED